MADVNPAQHLILAGFFLFMFLKGSVISVWNVKIGYDPCRLDIGNKKGDYMQTSKPSLTFHIIIPALFSILFFINAALPKTTLGCANRGIVAMAIAVASIMMALVTVIIGLKLRISKDPRSFWWIITTLILMIPSIALIYLA